MMKLRHSALSIAAGPVWLEALLAHSPDAAGLVLVPKPRTARIGGRPLEGADLLEWARAVVTGVLAVPGGATAPAGAAEAG